MGGGGGEGEGEGRRGGEGHNYTKTFTYTVNLSIKDTLHKGHLSNEGTASSPNHKELCQIYL